MTLYRRSHGLRGLRLMGLLLPPCFDMAVLGVLPLLHKNVCLACGSGIYQVQACLPRQCVALSEKRFTQPSPQALIPLMLLAVLRTILSGSTLL